MKLEIHPYIKGADDAAWVDIGNRVDAEDPEHVPSTIDEFRVIQDAPFFQVEGRFIAELDGAPVGVVNAHVDPHRAEPVGRMFGPAVLPESRRRGVGTALVDTCFASLRERGMERVRSGVAVADFRSDGIRMLEKRGFERVRVFSDMRVSLDSIATGVGENEAVALETMARTRENAALLVRLSNEAFVEHFGHRDTQDEEEEFWQERAKELGYFDETTLARVDGEPVGFMIHGWNAKENRVLGVDRGWVFSIGVLKRWRGRGIATRLLIHALAELKAGGMTEAGLGVDDTNVTGAFRLYEKVGFRVHRKSFTYERPLD